MDPVDELVGRSSGIVELRRQVQLLLSREGPRRRLPPVMITGEPGTGKSLLARILHRASSRSAAEFIELNAANPEQAPRGGTLFLDQVDRLPLPVQAKLLHVLDDGRDVCVISATSEDLRALIQAGRFREDLYHRLAVVELPLPALRERGDDIDLLATHALARACANQSGRPKELSPEARAALRAHRWPGNVSELNAVIGRAVLACPTAVIPAAALGLDPQVERRRLDDALAQTGWNISRTAARLGITRNTVRARIARYGLRGTDARSRPSIAVLPFRVEGEDATTSYFGDGIVEDIVGALATLGELFVISRSSTLGYRDASVDVRMVGRDVGVSYVLAGSVRRGRSSLRVSVELAATTDGGIVWASHFDGAADNVFALQDEIVTKVVTTIAPHVHDAELRRALRKRPDSLVAYACVLRAQALIYQLDPVAFADARTWLERAIALDPAYAMPYALLATWHSLGANQGWSADTAAAQEEVLRLATAALSRDGFDATALALCGHAKSVLRYEFDEALRLFDRAIEASPNSAIAWTRSAPTYAYIGDAQEAIRRAEHGLRLSPLDPHIFFPHTTLGLAHYVAGEHAEGARWGRIARSENPRYTGNLRLLAANLAALGQTHEAREVAHALVVVDPGFHVGRFVERSAIRDPERQARLARHLRLAGLPG